MIKLGVNIDHIATLRNARGEFFPSLIYAAGIVEENGGDFITAHLREDRRHIKDEDIFLLNDHITTYLNLEMACNEDVFQQAIKAKPYKATLVPEKREEVTTEGGLDVKNNFNRINEYVTGLKENGILVSLFIEPDLNCLEYYTRLAVDDIEIHTGQYANADLKEKPSLLKNIREFASEANSAGLKICAGHGLNYHNVQEICRIKEISELNIGYSIITRSIFSGLAAAVKEMSQMIKNNEIGY